MHYSVSVNNLALASIISKTHHIRIERIEWMIDDPSTGRRDEPIENFEAELDNG